MKDASTVPSTSKPPLKRRRLLRKITPPTLDTPVPEPSNRNLKPETTSKGTGSTASVCTSCHRACPSGNTIQCSVCSNTICAVCSRRCTHSAVSQPPTPHLSWSPSPSPSITGSPRRSRSVLSLVNTSNTNLPSPSEVPPTPTRNFVFGRRRKIVDEDDLAVNQVYSGPAKDRLLLAPGEVADERRGFQDEFGPGCGRLVCRKCCYEDVPSNTTTCLHCYGSHINSQ